MKIVYHLVPSNIFEESESLDLFHHFSNELPDR